MDEKESEKVRTDTIDVRGISTRYFLKKNGGTPIVFVNGFGLALSCWEIQIDYFSSMQTVLAYDWRGMGGTRGLRKTYTVGDLATDLYALLQKLEIKNPIICGHSMGGMIAMQYAVTYYNSYSAVVLVDTALTNWKQAFSNVLGYEAIEFFLHSDPKYLPWIDKSLLRLMAPSVMKQIYASEFVAAHPDFIKKAENDFVDNNTMRGLGLAFRAMGLREQVTPELDTVKVPAVLVWGNKDTIFSRQDMEDIQKAFVKTPGDGDFMEEDGPQNQKVTENAWLNGPALKVIRDAAHMCFQEKPEEFNDIVAKFIKTL